jgi:hypothetical protein
LKAPQTSSEPRARAHRWVPLLASKGVRLPAMHAVVAEGVEVSTLLALAAPARGPRR